MLLTFDTSCSGGEPWTLYNIIQSIHSSGTAVNVPPLAIEHRVRYHNAHHRGVELLRVQQRVLRTGHQTENLNLYTVHVSRGGGGCNHENACHRRRTSNSHPNNAETDLHYPNNAETDLHYMGFPPARLRLTNNI